LFTRYTLATKSTVDKRRQIGNKVEFRLCRRFVAGLSKVDCRRLVRLCRPCRGRHRRQSWTCSTRSILSSKVVYFFVAQMSTKCRTSFRLCRQRVRGQSLCRVSTKSTLSNSTLLPVCTGQLAAIMQHRFENLEQTVATRP